MWVGGWDFQATCRPTFEGKLRFPRQISEFVMEFSGTLRKIQRGSLQELNCKHAQTLGGPFRRSTIMESVSLYVKARLVDTGPILYQSFEFFLNDALYFRTRA